MCFVKYFATLYIRTDKLLHAFKSTQADNDSAHCGDGSNTGIPAGMVKPGIFLRETTVSC